MGDFAAAAVHPHRAAVVAVTRPPHSLDALRRVVKAELERDGVCASDVRVVWVDEEPRGFNSAADPAHSGWRRGDGELLVCVSVVCWIVGIIVFDEELAHG